MLYENIKNICKKKGIAVSKMESDLGFSRSSVCKWNDSDPGIKRVKNAADYLGVSVDYLLGMDAKESA